MSHISESLMMKTVKYMKGFYKYRAIRIIYLYQVAKPWLVSHMRPALLSAVACGPILNNAKNILELGHC